MVCHRSNVASEQDPATIQLSDENDAFFLHDAYSGFHASVFVTTGYVGDESVACFANIEEIRGMDGDDIIDLASRDYSLAGVALTIDGGEGNDVIWGSDANENISGGNGNDTIFGGVGTDALTEVVLLFRPVSSQIKMDQGYI